MAALSPKSIVRGLSMAPTYRLVAVAVTSFLGGVVLAGAAGFIGFNRYVNEQFISSYDATAVHAQFQVRTLSKLRNGKIDKVIDDLDLMLNSNTIQLANYEIIVPPERRDAYVYGTLAEIRAYRTLFPTHFDYPLQQETFQKALDLGRKPEG
jgi:hypothetical protein